VPSVLVVDDDPTVRELVGDILDLEGYDVHVAADGHQALAAVAAQRPDCLILDLMMPGMSGFEVLTHLRSADGGARLPVVMLTAAGEGEQSWNAWTVGVDYFLSKPFDTDQLLRCLEFLLPLDEE
jgi:DNA-binding response OmpR family regulator